MTAEILRVVRGLWCCGVSVGLQRLFVRFIKCHRIALACKPCSIQTADRTPRPVPSHRHLGECVSGKVALDSVLKNSMWPEHGERGRSTCSKRNEPYKRDWKLVGIFGESITGHNLQCRLDNPRASCLERAISSIFDLRYPTLRLAYIASMVVLVSDPRFLREQPLFIASVVIID